MPAERVTINLSPDEAGTLVYGLNAFVSMLTGQLEDAGQALTNLADEAGIMLLASTTAEIMGQVGDQLSGEGAA